MTEVERKRERFYGRIREACEEAVADDLVDVAQVGVWLLNCSLTLSQTMKVPAMTIVEFVLSWYSTPMPTEDELLAANPKGSA